MSHPSAGRVVDLYRRLGPRWDADRRSDGFPEARWLDRLLALTPPDGGILDMGCGGGDPIAVHLAAAGRRVTGIDSATAMIALCRSRLPAQRWIVADMRRLDLAERFAGLVAWDSFFHLSQADQRAMFPVFAAHAAPGAALLFTSGPAEGVAVGDLFGEPLHHASLNPEEYRSLLDDQNFEVVDFAPEDPDCGRHTIWLARLRGRA